MNAKERKIQQLYDLYRSIQTTLDDYEDKFQQLKETQSVNIQDILEFAERIAPSAFAPLGWNEGLPLLNAFPPAPQADQMRLGKLAEYNRFIDQQLLSLPPPPSSSSSQKKQGLSIEEQTRDIIKSFKEKLKIKKEQDAIKRERERTEQQEQQEESMDVTEPSPPPPIIESSDFSSATTKLDDSYVPTNTRKVNITFATADESESENEED